MTHTLLSVTKLNYCILNATKEYCVKIKIVTYMCVQKWKFYACIAVLCAIVVFFIQLFNKKKQTNKQTKKTFANKGKKKLREDLDSHFGRCPMKPIPCPNEGCSDQPILADMDFHVTKECSFRIKTCAICKKDYCFKDKIDHFKDPELLGHHGLKMANTV